MLGHGWQHGLLSKEVFTYGVYIIDEANADALRAKDNSVFIWSYAEDFVARNNLKAICTGMFISEPLDAAMNDLEYEDSDIRASNGLFAALLGNSLLRNGCVKEAY